MIPVPAPWGPHDPRALEEFGAALNRLITDYLATVRERPVRAWKPPAVLLEKWSASPADDGAGAQALLDGLREILADSTHLQHPRYAGHQVSAPIPAAAFIGAFEGVLNTGMAVGDMAPAASVIEAALIRWLGGKAGMGPDCAGYFTLGGSEANLVGLLAARAAQFPDVWQRGAAVAPGAALLVSSHAHYSVSRAAGIMGLGADALIPVPVDAEFRMTAAAARRALAQARAGGKRPFALVAAAGCTPTGTIDPLDELADLCATEKLWFHVDGAHGASLALSEKLAPRLAGLDRADSLAWDPHKLMSLPLGMGAILTRERGALLNAYRQHAPYIFHPESAGAALPNPGEISLSCSRPGEVIKLWGVLTLYGAQVFAKMVEIQCANAARFHALLEESGDFIALNRPDTNIVCFLHRPAAWAELPDAELGARNYRLHEALNRSGEGWITSTVLEGRRVLRCTFMNAATTEGDLVGIVEALRRLGKQVE